jgi:acyl-CoA synthetase (AMP-forming)/AMP-acid ligase II
MIDKGFLHGSLLLFLGVIIGLSASNLSCDPVPVEGLIFVEGLMSGHSGNDSSTVVYKYNLTFYNSGNENIYVNTIEPVLSSDPRILSTQHSLVSEINRYVSPDSVVSIEGSILINSENSSKEDLIDIEQTIRCINMTSTETIHCFNYPPE